ncbi:MAG: hypothetical protein M4579_003614 [Chaenotheca gracillima]|nr:MAG: hypothetical protein M4579_003614 [Chaenotheca gracillima]
MAPRPPPIAPFPPLSVRKGMVSEDWEACLEAWVILTQYYLQQSRAEFEKSKSADHSLSHFLMAFCHEISLSQSKDTLPESQNSKTLRKHVFLLSHRILCDTGKQSVALLDWSFLADFSAVFARSVGLRKTLRIVWANKASNLEKELGTLKNTLTGSLESPNQDEAELMETLRRLSPLLYASPDAANFFMIGSDFLDALSTGYKTASPALRKRMVAVAYLSLKGLTDLEKPALSLLIDLLYSLKSSESSEPRTSSTLSTLLSDLVQTTPLISRFREKATGPDAARAKPLIESLDTFEKTTGPRPKKLIRRKISKGKSLVDGIELDGQHGHGAANEMHIHRLSLVSQVQDLFPDLGDGFVMKLLDEYGENVEQVTAHLLDDSLPPHLRDVDRSQSFSPSTLPASKSQKPVPSKAPEPPSIPRRNVFDDDELDTLAVPASRLHIGRRNPNQTADQLLNDEQRRTASSKSAILAALASFDADDDERDDTYDASDVGDTVDSAAPTAPDEVDADISGNEETLYTAWRSTPDVFGRDAATRRSPARTALRSETKMTDEAIEGWAVMLGRDPRKLRTLEAKYAFAGGSGGKGGRQTELRRTAWRGAGSDESGTEGSDGTDLPRGGGRGRGRGRGGGGRGGVGAPGGGASASDSAGTNNRRRKEASKGSRANHNRRDQRAKKMARGGGMLGA